MLSMYAPVKSGSNGLLGVRTRSSCQTKENLVNTQAVTVFTRSLKIYLRTFVSIESKSSSKLGVKKTGSRG